ncbi:MAG TPA: beta-ketoacyl synthase N-terminal-like domain-containing protein [Polyangiales bacterium]|jgi:3-oxoacyl-(acyl-carrier-protein) synthase|nr:beta-ketoacyl synthase N-terminal-like domain-containing protein [Polyangiales bacterium]
MTPYAITGLGLVSALGVSYRAFESALAEWSRAPSDLFAPPMQGFDPKHVEASLVAECRDFDAKQQLGDKGLRNFDRLTKLLVVSGKLALEDAGLKRDGVHRIPPDRIGLCSATAYGSIEAITEAVQITELEDPRFLNPNRFPNTVINASAGYVSIWEDLRAPNVTVVNGNCGALDAVLNGATHVLQGRADAFLVGGGEALSEPLYSAFRKLDVLADRGRVFAPGEARSQGMRIGEGAAYLCIEQLDFARDRGADVRAEVVGYGNAFEPPESEAVLVHVSGRAVERAIRMALADAEIEPNAIDVVASGQSGIARFDAAELAGIDAALGREVAVATPKSIYGETFGAGGAFAMACATAWFGGVPVAPLLRRSHQRPPKHILVTAAGYYGNASAVVMRRHG